MPFPWYKNTYLEGGIDILYHFADIIIVFVNKLINLSEFLLKRPVTKLRDLTPLDLIYGQKLLIMFLMTFKETGLTYQTTWLHAIRMNAYIHDIFTIVTLMQTFRC